MPAYPIGQEITPSAATVAPALKTTVVLPPRPVRPPPPVTTPKSTVVEIPWLTTLRPPLTVPPDGITDYPLPPDYYEEIPTFLPDEFEKPNGENSLNNDYGFCNGGLQPLFLKAVGIKTHETKGSEGLVTKLISEEDCLTACRTDTAPNGSPFECIAFEYDRRRKTCTLLEMSESDKVIKRYEQNVLYEKLCIPADLVAKCGTPVVERFPQMILIGFNERSLNVDSVQMCLENCLDSEKRMGFQCRSGMFYGSSPNMEENCLLNSQDHGAHSELFVEEDIEPVEYFAVTDCYLKSLKQFKTEAGRYHGSLKSEFYTNFVKRKFDDPNSREERKGSVLSLEPSVVRAASTTQANTVEEKRNNLTQFEMWIQQMFHR